MNKITLQTNKSKNMDPQASSRTEPTIQPSQNSTSWLALGAVAGPILWTLAWLSLGFVSPGYVLWGTEISPYSPVSLPISGLGLGPTALYMNTAFIISGAMIISGAYGIFSAIPELGKTARWTGTILLALIGFGLVLSGIFTLESILLHTVGLLLAFGTPGLSFLVLGIMLSRISNWRQFGSWLLLGGPLSLLILVPPYFNFNPIAAGAGLAVTGLAQRILVTEVMTWIVALGLKAYRQKSDVVLPTRQ